MIEMSRLMKVLLAANLIIFIFSIFTDRIVNALLSGIAIAVICFM